MQKACVKRRLFLDLILTNSAGLDMGFMREFLVDGTGIEPVTPAV
jgi:hypothetical protein